MKIKNLFTSIVGIFAAFTTHAAFATGEYENNETYSSACDYGILNTYSGTKGATAIFEICPANTYSDNNDCVSCPSGYPNSPAGAESQDACYRSCVASDVAHAATVTGILYSDGTDLCAASTCNSGYFLFEPPTTSGPNVVGCVGGNSCQNGEGLNTGEWRGVWNGKGTLKGVGICSNENQATEVGTTISVDTFVSSDSGNYCWCKPTSWTYENGEEQNLTARSLVLAGYGYSGKCSTSCAYSCSNKLGQIRAELFSSVNMSTNKCLANTITINWGDASNGIHESNTCTYGGDITTPTTAPTKPGYRFIGWVFD